MSISILSRIIDGLSDPIAITEIDEYETSVIVMESHKRFMIPLIVGQVLKYYDLQRLGKWQILSARSM